MPNLSVGQWLIVGAVVLFFLTILVRALMSGTAQRESAWNRVVRDDGTRPSPEDILKSIHGLISEHLHDRGLSDAEAEEKAVDVGIFLEKTFLRFKDPWEGLETAVVEALIGQADGFDKKSMWSGFDVLRFETVFVNHDPEGDLYELSEEFERALKEFACRPSISLDLLPSVSLEAKSEGAC